MIAMEPTRETITRLCREASRAEDGNRAAVDSLVDHVYTALRRMASKHMRAERDDHTLSPTALVHEAYIKLLDQEKLDWRDRAHFYAVAARIMRRILIDHARARLAGKRGGDQVRVTFTEEVGGGEFGAESLLELDRALDKLEELSPRQRQAVELRFFGGMTHEEVAAVLGVSEPTIRRDWRLAQAWLQREMSG